MYKQTWVNQSEVFPFLLNLKDNLYTIIHIQVSWKQYIKVIMGHNITILTEEKLKFIIRKIARNYNFI